MSLSLNGIVGSPVTAQLTAFQTGLVGSLGWRVISVPSGSTISGYARTTTGVTEIPSGSGVYYVTFNRPSPAGDYAIAWDAGGEFAEEAFTTTTTPSITAPPAGMCAAWISDTDVASQYGYPNGGSDPTIYTDAADAASLILYRLSGQRFGGSCTTTVRPCRSSCGCFGSGWGGGWGASAWGWSGLYGSWMNESGDQCGCGSVSQIRLEDYPVTSITEIRVDGQLIDAAQYRLDEYRYVTYLDDSHGHSQFWPACQDLAVPKDTIGAFSVSYTYGEVPPTSGIRAAEELAYQLYLQSSGQSCGLPAATSQVTRQGVTYSTDTVYDMLGKGTTGLAWVDAFLASENPNGWRHKPSVWSPDLPQPPRRITT